MAKIGIISLCLALLGFTGCGLFVPRENQDPVQVQASIYRITKAATVTALTQVHKDDSERKLIETAAEIVVRINENVMPTLVNPDAEVTRAIADTVTGFLDPEYQALMVLAFELFHQHYIFPTTSDVLPDEQRAYLEALARGIRDGAQQLLTQHNVMLRADYSIMETPEGRGS